MLQFLLLTATFLMLAACGSATDERGPLLVSVASSQTETFEVAATSLNATLDAIRIELNFAGSTTLVNQVNEGAPVSVIVVADRVAADAIGVEVYREAVVAENHIVAVAHDDAGPIFSFEDLANPDLVIAGCDPSVPCGRLTDSWLLETAAQVEIDTQEQNVRQVLARVESGEADVGFVYESDARRLERDDRAKLLELGRSTTMSESWALLLTDDPETSDLFDRLVTGARTLNGLAP